ncbi:MAG: hypothetical protein HYV60_18500, partial [Planctomycetia bacterium]|nr:hypothetical protein [Planctomycetia bacterium]
MLTRIQDWPLLFCLMPVVVVVEVDHAVAGEPRQVTASTEHGAAITMDTVRQKLSLAHRTLEYVEKREPRPELAADLRVVTREVNSIDAGTDLSALLERISQLRRNIIFSHPDLAFDKLLINLQSTPLISHMVDQYLARQQLTGKGLATIEDWKSNPRL